MTKRKTKKKELFGWIDVLGAICLVLFLTGMVIVLLAAIDRYLLPKIVTVIGGGIGAYFTDYNYRFIVLVPFFVLAVIITIYLTYLVRRGEKQ